MRFVLQARQLGAMLLCIIFLTLWLGSHWGQCQLETSNSTDADRVNNNPKHYNIGAILSDRDHILDFIKVSLKAKEEIGVYIKVQLSTCRKSSLSPIIHCFRMRMVGRSALLVQALCCTR